jgi:hypothetical protein
MTSNVDTAQLRLWAEQLKAMYPQLPEGVIDNTLVQYAKNPIVFNEVCDDFKANPTLAKERDNQAVYDTTYSGNDIPWGKPSEYSEI